MTTKTTSLAGERTQNFKPIDMVKIARSYGRDAVREKPWNAPRNPYNEDTQPDLYEAWDEGADEAGISDIYTNGVLNKGER